MKGLSKIALASIAIVLIPTASSWAYETCEEYCPTRSEAGFASFIDSSASSVLCCCLTDEESDRDTMTSKPVVQCK